MRATTKRGIALRTAAFVPVMTLLVAACGGSGDDGGMTARTAIDASGGTVTSADGRLVLDFPEGALPAENTITIERLSSDDLPSEFQGIEAEAAYVLRPDGLSFDEPVQVRLDTQADPVNDEGDLEARTGTLLTEGNGTAVAIPDQQTRLSPDGVSLTGELQHFSTLVETKHKSVVTISGVPHTMAEGETFTAKATVAVAPFADEAIEIREAVYLHDVADNAPIVPPETPRFDTDLSSPADPPPDKVRLVEADIEYRCQDDGEQRYNPVVGYDLINQPQPNSFRGRVVTLNQTIFCLDPDASQSTLTPGEDLLAALSPGAVSRNIGQLFQVETELEVNEPDRITDIVITTTEPGIVSFPPTLASSTTDTTDLRPLSLTLQESVFTNIRNLRPGFTSSQRFTYECIGAGETKLVYGFEGFLIGGQILLTTDVECTSGDVDDGGNGSGGDGSGGDGSGGDGSGGDGSGGDGSGGNGSGGDGSGGDGAGDQEAGVLISNTSQEFDGSPKPVAVSTDPSGLDVEVTYDGSPEPPTNAGSYNVVATVQDDGFTGEAVAILSIDKASAGILFSDTRQEFDGNPKPVTVLTAPAELSTTVTYDGSEQAPSAVGTYQVEATVTDDNYEGTATATLEIVNTAQEPNDMVSLVNAPGSLVSLPDGMSFGNTSGDEFQLGVVYPSEDIGSTTFDVYNGGLQLRASFDFSGSYTLAAAPLEITDDSQIKDGLVVSGTSGAKLFYQPRGSIGDMLESQELVARFTDNVPDVEVAQGPGENPLIGAISFESGLVQQFGYNPTDEQFVLGADFTVDTEDANSENFFVMNVPDPGFAEPGKSFAALTSDGENGSLYTFTAEGSIGDITIVGERQDNVSDVIEELPVAFECASWDPNGTSVCAVTNNDGSGALIEYRLEINPGFSVLEEFNAGVRAVQPALKRDGDTVMFAIPDRTTDSFVIGTVQSGTVEHQRNDVPAECDGPTHAKFGPATGEGTGLLFLGCGESENLFRTEVNYNY